MNDGREPRARGPWLALCALLPCATLSAQATQIGSRLELFVDEQLIEKLDGTATLVVHRPKPAEVVLVTDEPWEGNTCAYYTVFRDGDLFRMYYRGWHYDAKTRRAGHREVTCYAESRDGIHWTKPKLGLFEFDGSKQNNIVWDGIGTHCFTPFKDENPACKPDARYKAIARGRPRGKKGLYVFKSPDGIHWQMLRDGPVITNGAFDSQNLAFWDVRAGEYREFHRTFVKGVRTVMATTSKDFVKWAEPGLLRFGDAPAEHLYTNAILQYPRAPHLLLGFPTRYLPKQGSRVEPLFMSSRDGVSFRRFEKALIPVDAPADRDGNRSNYMAWGLVRLPGRDNELSVYATEAYYKGPDSRLRRFTFRLDGFASVRATEKQGGVLTKTLEFTGGRLEVNFKTSGEGAVRVGIQDDEGNAIPGFTIEECVPLRGDAIARTVAWNNGASVGELAGTPIRLRFELRAADVFAFRFSE